MYKAVFSKCTATSFMACVLGGSRPQSSQLPVFESDEDWDGGPDLSEQPSPYSGDKRASCLRQYPKQARNKKGKGRVQSADETFVNITSIMIE